MTIPARIGLSLAVAALSLLTPARPAHADAAGDAVLAQMDAAVTKYKTLVLDYAGTNKEAGKDERPFQVKVQIKGEKRLSEFSAPADVKGTKVLVLSPTQTYVYLPSLGKVRRVASHTTDQGFLGMTFSHDDMATTSLGSEYTAVVASEDAATWTLTLTPRAGRETIYAKIEVTVQKDKKVPSTLKYFNAEGKNVKTETRTGYSCEGDVCSPTELKMTDNVRGAWTKLVVKNRSVNKDLLDETFSQRNLGG